MILFIPVQCNPPASADEGTIQSYNLLPAAAWKSRVFTYQIFFLETITTTYVSVLPSALLPHPFLL